MAANILNIPGAVATSVSAIRAFVELRWAFGLLHSSFSFAPTSAAQARNRLPRRRRPHPLAHQEASKGLSTKALNKRGHPATLAFSL